MGRSQGIFLGEVNRISSSGNAIVSHVDIRPLSRTEPESILHSKINLGPLPPEAVGEEVLFTYEGGTFGFCIDDRYNNDSYAQDMPGQVKIESGELDISVPEIIDPGDILFLKDLFQIPKNLRIDAQYIALAKMSPEQAEELSEEYYTSNEGLPILILDSDIQREFPVPLPVSVEVKKVHSMYVETTGALNKTDDRLPDIGETITVTTGPQTEMGTLGMHEAEYLTTVLLKDTQYLHGETIKVQVNDTKSTHIICEAISVPDAEMREEFSVRVIGKQSNDALAIKHKSLVMIPDSSIVSPGDRLRVSLSESASNDVTTATVSARPIFQETETTHLIRLPNTRGDVVQVNETPVVVDHLPELDSTVTLGVSEINEDHVVPSISALPKSHTPDKEDYVLVEIDNASSGITAGTSEELPVTSLLPPEEQSGDAVTAQVRGYSQSVIWVASDDIEEYIQEDIGNIYRYLQQADSALCQRKYQDVIQPLDKAIKSCPSSSVLERLLMIQKTMARAMISIKNNSNLTDIADAVSSEAKQLREFDERQETASAITALLLARKAEMEATERFLTGLSQAPDDVNKEVLSCRLAIREGIESLKRAKGHAAKTPFEQQTPSSAVWLVTQEFQDSLPFNIQSIDTLQQSHSVRDNNKVLSLIQEFETIFPANSFQNNDTDWLQHAFSREVSNYINRTANNDSLNSDTNTWHRPATPETMGVTPIAEIENNNNSHIESAQNSDSETSTTEQTSTSKDDSEGGAETISAGGTSSSTPTAETNETETQTEPESSIGPTNSTGGSPTTNLPKLQRLRKQAEKESSENPKREDVSSSTTTTSRYKRSSAVREYALARAEGTCEACKKDAPFLKESGDPYLEVHHVNELSDGGADDPSIVGAVCPSCHKEIHYGKHGDELNEKLRERLQDGLGDVGVVDE